jgi:hypothetical protein
MANITPEKQPVVVYDIATGEPVTVSRQNGNDMVQHLKTHTFTKPGVIAPKS